MHRSMIPAGVATLVLLGAIAMGASGSNAPSVPTTHASHATAPPHLGLVVDGQGRVLHVESGSAAEAAGLRVGDRITAIGDTPVSDGASIRSRAVERATRNAAAPFSYTLTIEREGKTEQVRVQPGHGHQYEGKPTPTPVTQDQHFL